MDTAGVRKVVNALPSRTARSARVSPLEQQVRGLDAG